MIDPYSVLGVSPNASDDDIKKAYRNLSRKYHPDANINNPNKAQAEEKFKQVQAAYDQIQQMKKGTWNGGPQSSGYNSSSGPYGGFSGFDGFGGFGGFGGFNQGFNQSSAGNGQPDYLRSVRTYIQSGHYREALNLLNNIQDRSAEWYYLSAIANVNLGNNVVAKEHAEQATRMAPGNMQYQQLLQSLRSGNTWYTQQAQDYGNMHVYSGSTCTKLCLGLMACNLCCGGGGLYYGGLCC